MPASTLTRRTLLGNLAALTAGGLVPPLIHAQLLPPAKGGATGQQRGEMERLANEFRRQFGIPASSIAIARNGAFAFDRAVGMAQVEKAQQVQETSLFRIANCTMPITAVTIFRLIEQGKLHLNDKVFGPSGILSDRYGKPPYKQYVTDITVDHLLTHTSGGWPDDSTDPMFRSDSWDQPKLISWTLENLPLTSPPGQHWAFSNFGYCVLGRVIEQVTGQSYAAYVQANILAPCGITDMRIAANKMGERAPNEVVYYGQYSEDPYKINVTRLDSQAGWIATASDLVIFLDHIAGAPGIPALLKAATIRTMTTPAPAYPAGSDAKYARGWMVGNNAAWWHSGSLPGSTTIVGHTPSGFSWAALMNSRTQPHAEIDTALNQMMWTMLRSVPQWNP